MADAVPQQLTARFDSVSDDVMMCIFAPLSLLERLRVFTVSKRWQRLLTADLRFNRELAWRSPAVVKRAGDALRTLTLTGLAQSPDLERILDGLVHALGGGGGGAAAQLQTFITWQEPSDGVLVTAEGPVIYPTFSPEQALRLAASCPRLGAESRLAVDASSTAQALALLDALPGRHAVVLKFEFDDPESDSNTLTIAEVPAVREQAGRLARHPRLCALYLDTSQEEDEDDPRLACFHAAAATVATALQRRDGCSLEYLHVGPKARGVGLGEALANAPAPATAASASTTVASASTTSAAAAATSAIAEGPSGGATEALPAPRAGAEFRGFRAIDVSYGAPGRLTRTAIAAAAASRGSLQHFSAEIDSAFTEPAGGGAGALARLLERLGGCLRTLTLHVGELGGSALRNSSLLAGLAPQLASPGCRLETLVFRAGLYTGDAEEDEEDEEEEAPENAGLSSFLQALSSNASLGELVVEATQLSGQAFAQRLVAPLSERVVPLRSLDVEWSTAEDTGY